MVGTMGTFIILILIFGFIFYFRFKYIVSGNKSLPEKVTNIENINWEHLTFLVTYVIPLLSFDLDFNLDEDRNSLMFFLVLIIGTTDDLINDGKHTYLLFSLSSLNNLIILI